VSQDQWITLCYKIAVVGALLTIPAFVLCYSRWASWWRDPVGRTIVAKDLLLAFALIPVALSLFLQFSRLTSRVAAWTDIALIGLISPVMIWRIAVFWKLHRQGPRTGGHPGRGSAG
jgi:hypothetical protein